MKPLLALLLTTGSSLAQQNTVRVRLFSQSRVQQIQIEPIVNVLIRKCATCAATPLRVARNFTTGSNAFLSGTYRIAAANAPVSSFNGDSHIASDAGGMNITVVLPREDYVAAVLAGEVAPDSPPEFLKAMAVAVRSYAFHESSRHHNQGFDFCDSTHCQNLKLDRVDSRFHAAVEATKNELLWSAGKPMLAYYHQDCGGRTASERESWPVAASAPYLTSHDDPYCQRANGIRWQSELSKHDLARALTQFPALHLPNVAVAIGERGLSGRVRTLRFNQAPLSASTFRFAVGRALGWNLVRSDLYDLRDLGDRILLTGRGSGHGVGLCQNGATQMAREGKTYRDILAFYYPGTRIGISAQEIPWQRLTADNLILWTTDPARDGSLLEQVPLLRSQIETETGLHNQDTLQLRVYTDLTTYRNATGEPGWIAAYSQRNSIHLQPLATLRDRGLLDSTLRHELLHHAVDANTHAQLPRWFREGLVEYLADSQIPPKAADIAALDTRLAQRTDAASARAAYRESAGYVALLIERYGKRHVLSWLSSGIPADALRR